MNDDDMTVADLVEEFLAASLSGEYVSVALAAVDVHGSPFVKIMTSEDRDGGVMFEAFAEAMGAVTIYDSSEAKH